MKVIMENWRKFVVRESQFAATAAEEAAKVNRDLGDDPAASTSLPEDQAYWDKHGISTGEELAIELVGSTYSDMYKSVHGIRPRQGFDTFEQAQEALNQLDKYVQAAAEQDELDAQAEAEYQQKKAELQALMPGEYEAEYEKMPQPVGMGRAAGMREDETLEENPLLQRLLRQRRDKKDDEEEDE